MTVKNRVCLWYNHDAQDAANFYAATFPDTKVEHIQRAPADYPDGREGDVFTVEFTVVGIPCIAINGDFFSAQRMMDQYYHNVYITTGDGS